MIVYLNNDFLPLNEARISPLDRGFLFGDGVYEVIPAYSNVLFRIDEHLKRLENSLRAIYMDNPHTPAQWVNIFEQLIERQSHTNHSIYLQVTRGADTKRDHVIPESISPTVFIMSTPLEVPTTIHSEGVAVITQADSRWQHCDIKAVTLLANIMHKHAAIQANSTETLLIRDGNVMEGSASNIFIVKNSVITTPPKSPLLLPGITRDLVLEIAQTNQLPTEETDIPVEDLFSAKEVWITSSTREIVPVTLIDDNRIGNGNPGPVWQQMIAFFQEYKQALMA